MFLKSFSEQLFFVPASISHGVILCISQRSNAIKYKWRWTFCGSWKLHKGIKILETTYRCDVRYALRLGLHNERHPSIIKHKSSLTLMDNIINIIKQHIFTSRNSLWLMHYWLQCWLHYLLWDSQNYIADFPYTSTK